MDNGAATDEAGGDDFVLRRDVGEFGARDAFGPDSAARPLDQIMRRAFELNASAGQHRHARTQVGDILDDMRRQDDDDILADLDEQVEEAVAFFGIKPGGRFVDDDQPRIADQRLGDAKALPHAARKAGDGLFADVPEIGLRQQGFDRRLAFSGGRDALENAHVLKHVIGRHARINAEILRQIAQRRAQFLGVGDDVDITETDGPGGRRLQRRDAAHQRRFAGAVGPEQPEHAGGNCQADIIERTRAIGIDMADMGELEHRFSLLWTAHLYKVYCMGKPVFWVMTACRQLVVTGKQGAIRLDRAAFTRRHGAALISLPA